MSLELNLYRNHYNKGLKPLVYFDLKKGCYIDIIDHKLWIQHDGTEEGIAVDLVAEGVPKTDIVLSFRPLAERKYTDFAVS